MPYSYRLLTNTLSSCHPSSRSGLAGEKIEFTDGEAAPRTRYFAVTLCGNFTDVCPDNLKYPSMETYPNFQGCRRGIGLLPNAKLVALPNDKEGVQVNYRNDAPAQTCTGSFGESVIPVTTLNMECNEAISKYKVGKVVYDPALWCKLEVTIESKHACAKAVEPKPITIGGDGIGGGWIFLTVLAVGFILYLTGGIVYKRSVKGAAGIEMIPNVDFWREFFASVSEGGIIVWYAMTCRKRPGNEAEVYHGLDKLPGEEE